jgi:hypothetical protein
MPKLRYCCEKEGCFNKKKRPKIEVFDDCFPGDNAFGDVDGNIEHNGRFLYLEWKPAPFEISRGQHIALSRRTFCGESFVVVAAGDAETMTVTHYGTYDHGKWGGWKEANLEDLRSLFKKWWAWADKQVPPERARAARKDLTQRIAHSITGVGDCRITSSSSMAA